MQRGEGLHACVSILYVIVGLKIHLWKIHQLVCRSRDQHVREYRVLIVFSYHSINFMHNLLWYSTMSSQLLLVSLLKV